MARSNRAQALLTAAYAMNVNEINLIRWFDATREIERERERVQHTTRRGERDPSSEKNQSATLARVTP